MVLLLTTNYLQSLMHALLMVMALAMPLETIDELIYPNAKVSSHLTLPITSDFTKTKFDTTTVYRM